MINSSSSYVEVRYATADLKELRKLGLLFVSAPSSNLFIIQDRRWKRGPYIARIFKSEIDNHYIVPKRFAQ